MHQGEEGESGRTNQKEFQDDRLNVRMGGVDVIEVGSGDTCSRTIRLANTVILHRANRVVSNVQLVIQPSFFAYHTES